MNVLSCSINTLNGLYDLSGVEVGQHFYWKIGGFQVHGQVLITSWVVIAILLGSATLAVRNPQSSLNEQFNKRARIAIPIRSELSWNQFDSGSRNLGHLNERYTLFRLLYQIDHNHYLHSTKLCTTNRS